MISLTINGNKIEVEEGTSVLEAADSIGIQIPKLCYHKALSPYGACRLCLVEITLRGRTKIQASCTCPAMEGQEIQTNTERVQKTRRIMIELLLARCPDSEEIKKMAVELGADESRLKRLKKKNEDCILCGLCVRMCRERMGRVALSFTGRGYLRKVESPYGEPSDVCQTCGACEFVCPTGKIILPGVSEDKPVPILSEYNMGLNSRPAVYIPYPQAIPNKATIDTRYCVQMNRGDCGICSEICESGAINYDMEPETQEKLNVGAVILAPGYDLFNANGRLEYGYWQFPNVVTALEFERILGSTGPYLGHVLRPSDRQPPRKIAFVQCVGSRDDKRNYCSSICCMYATKEAIIAKEHASTELDCHVYYMDIRAYGKGFEEYYERAKELGVKYFRCRPSSVEEIDDNNLRITTMSEEGSIAVEDYDMVILSTGLQPPPSVKEFSKKLGIELNSDNFCLTDPFKPVESNRKGVFVCGPFTEPKDIPETVMEASGASAKVLSMLSDVKGSLITIKEFPPEKDVTGEPPRIGVFICHCGTNIASVVNVPEVVEYAKSLPNVVYSNNNLYTCSNDTQDKIKELIEEHNLNRVIVASCTPRTHEPMFRNTIQEGGLNPYLFEMANIRDQCSWIHMKEPEMATRKAKDLVRMAVAKARIIEPLYSIKIPVNKGVLVIGAGMSGMTAALNLAGQGFEVNLVEKEDKPGGNLQNIYYTIGGKDPQKELKEIIRKVNKHPKIQLRTGAEIKNIDGFIGNFTTTVGHNGKSHEIEHGAVIVATGAEQHTPEEYMYGSDERVITQLDLEAQLAKGKFDAKRVVMIQCVGSREGEKMYCSRVCCAQAVKNAINIKREYPDADIYILYRELRTYGFSEKYYTQARRMGIKFIRYDIDNKPAVNVSDGKLIVDVREPILGRTFEIDSDLLVLAPAIVPREDAEILAKMLKVPLTKEKFYLEAHMKLRPVDFATDGVFLAGMAHSPKTITESISQGMAAASRVATILSKDMFEAEATISSVNEDICSGCGICASVCEFDALSIVDKPEGGSVVEINEALCKGCGCCAGICPSGALEQKGFKNDQILAAIDAALV